MLGFISMAPELASAVDSYDFEQFPLFRGVDVDVLRRLLAEGRTLDVGAGETVTSEKVDDRRAYVILSGRLTVHVAASPKEPIAVAGPGDLIGELAMLIHGERSASVVAAEPSRLFVIDETAFWDFVNDSFGHPAGDRVLAAVGRAIVSSLRPADISARVGGEEFAVIVLETPIEHAVAVAERIRQKVAQARIAMTDTSETSVTVSIGVAALQSGESSIDLYAAADAALYQAKEAGRNRVTTLSR
jgi:diguanylate cyclase (GGDEF)-like protein